MPLFRAKATEGLRASHVFKVFVLESRTLWQVAFTPEGKPNKFWVCFAKRKFMNTVIG